jgi:hypothetical protein
VFRRSTFALALALTVAVSALLVSPGLAAPTRGSDIETYTGSVSASARTLKVFDPAGALVAWIDVPGEVTGLWSTYVPVNPGTTYRVQIAVSSGSTKYTLYVNHCPDGVCF